MAFKLKEAKEVPKRPDGQVIEPKALGRPSGMVIMCKKTECIHNKDYLGIPYCHRERGIILEKDGYCFNIELHGNDTSKGLELPHGDTKK